jgi:hypothetical protein
VQHISERLKKRGGGIVKGQHIKVHKNRAGKVGWQLTPVIPPTREAEMGRITVRGQRRKTVLETLSPKSRVQNGLEECLQGWSACCEV